MEQRTRNIILGLFGLGAVCVVCACAGAFMAPRAALYIAGFGEGRDTAEVLGNLGDGGITINEEGDLVTAESEANTTQGIAPTPIVVIQELDQVTVQLDGQSNTIDLNALGVDEAVQGTSAEGSEVYYFEYDEASINEMFVTMIWPEAPADVTSQVQNVMIDLKPNAAVIHGEANLGFGAQPLAIILGVDAGNARFAVIGVEWNGLVFETPPNGPIGEWVQLLETEGNRALDQLVLLGSDGTPLSVQHLAVEDGRLRVTAGN